MDLIALLPNAKQTRGNQIQSFCPINNCGKDGNRPFGVRLLDNNQVTYNCFVCEARGGTISLKKILGADDWKFEVRETKQREKDPDFCQKAWDAICNARIKDHSKFIRNWCNSRTHPYDERHIESICSSGLVAYTDGEINTEQLRGMKQYNLKGGRDIIIPMYDTRNRVVQLSMRSSWNKKLKQKSMRMPSFIAQTVEEVGYYGFGEFTKEMRLAHEKNQWLYIVEGGPDYLISKAMGRPTLGAPNAKGGIELAKALKSKMLQLGISLKIRLIPDPGVGEEAFIKAAEILTPCAQVEYAPAELGMDLSELASTFPDDVILNKKPEYMQMSERPLTIADVQKSPAFKQRLRSILTNAKSNDVAIVKVPPGCGKTFTSLQLMEEVLMGFTGIQADHPTAVFALPNHALCEEKIEEFKNISVYGLKNRVNYLKGLLRHCQFSENVKSVYASVGRSGVCGVSLKGKSESACELASTCKGAEEPRAVNGFVNFCPHALAPKLEADLFVFDENPGVLDKKSLYSGALKSLFHNDFDDWSNQSMRSLAKATYAQAAQIAKDFVEAISDGTERPFTKTFKVELDESMLGLAAQGDKPPRPNPKHVREGRKDRKLYPNFYAYQIFKELADLEDNKVFIEVNTKGKWSLFFLKPRKLPDAPIVVLDATGDYLVDEWRAAYPERNVDLINIDVSGASPKASVHFKTSLFNSSGFSKGLQKEHLLSLKEILKSEHITGGEAGFLIKKKFYDLIMSQEEKWRSEFGKIFDDVIFGYYGRDDRGTNKFQEVDHLILLGDPTPNMNSVTIEANYLRLDPEKVIRNRTLDIVIQAIFRARHLSRKKNPPTITYCGQNTPHISGVNWKRRVIHLNKKNSSPETISKELYELVPKGMCAKTSDLHQLLQMRHGDTYDLRFVKNLCQKGHLEKAGFRIQRGIGRNLFIFKD